MYGLGGSPVWNIPELRIALPYVTPRVVGNAHYRDPAIHRQDPTEPPSIINSLSWTGHTDLYPPKSQPWR